MRRSWLCCWLVACAPVEELPPRIAPAVVAARATAPATAVAPTPGPSSGPAATSATLAPAASSPAAALTAPSDPEDEDAEVVESGSFSEPQRLVMKAVGLCLERALRHGPGPGGSLALDLTVESDGTVAKVVMGPGYPAAARPCVEARLKALRYPEEASGGTRFFRYPINEQPGE